jgi:hypothetical protein
MEPASSVRAIRRRQREMGRGLRRIYGADAADPVPSEFLDLLNQIDQKLNNTDRRHGD